MFIPNNQAWLRRAAAQRDVRGERVYAPAIRVPCSVITLNLEIEKTSVRADSSGSRGKAEEDAGIARLLFPPYVTVADFDIVEVENEVLEVIQVNPRRDIIGRLDHNEVDLRKAQRP